MSSEFSERAMRTPYVIYRDDSFWKGVWLSMDKVAVKIFEGITLPIRQLWYLLTRPTYSVAWAQIQEVRKRIGKLESIITEQQGSIVQQQGIIADQQKVIAKQQSTVNELKNLVTKQSIDIMRMKKANAKLSRRLNAIESISN
jgi:uncharacterized coiled-coil protein SlyX